MISFQANDMTCGHCVSAITLALQGVDTGATVQIDLATHSVHIEPGDADAAQLRDAIQVAGCTPVPTEGPASDAAISVVPARKECCCGSFVPTLAARTHAARTS
jgi:copper chaperone